MLPFTHIITATTTVQVREGERMITASVNQMCCQKGLGISLSFGGHLSTQLIRNWLIYWICSHNSYSHALTTYITLWTSAGQLYYMYSHLSAVGVVVYPCPLLFRREKHPYLHANSLKSNGFRTTMLYCCFQSQQLNKMDPYVYEHFCEFQGNFAA